MKLNIKSKLYMKRAILISIAIVIAINIPSHIMPFLLSANASPQTDALQAEIDAINNQIASYNVETARLHDEAQTLQNAIARLSAEKAIIQAQLDISQIKKDKLIVQIAETEQKIVDNKNALGTIIASLYVDDKISPIEMLASSNTISDFLDKQEYRSSVRDKLVSTIGETKNLKASLEVQKVEVERVLNDQQVQRNALAAKEAEQQSLLSETKGQESLYQSLIAQKTAERADKQAQIDYFNSLASSGSSTLVPGDPNKGGYPDYLANSGQDSVVDPWGMYNRECVSYVAWKVNQSYGNMPYWGGIGNAWQWAFSGWSSGGVRVFYESGNWHTANSDIYGVPSGTEPKIRSAAVTNATPSNPWGHIAWVEAVLPDNKIKISQYNWYVASLGGWGQYSEMIVDSSIFQRYIYFGEW